MSRRGIAVALALAFVLVACGGGGGASVASFCSEARKADKSTALKNADITTKQGIQDLKSEMSKLESEAPSAIKGDVTTLVDLYDKIASKGVTSLTPADEAKAKTAGDSLTAFMKNTCHLTSTT